MSLRIESNEVYEITVNGNRGSLVKKGGFYVFGKIYLEILVDQNTQRDNFCKILGPHRNSDQKPVNIQRVCSEGWYTLVNMLHPFPVIFSIGFGILTVNI